MRIGNQRVLKDAKCEFNEWNGGRIALVETWKESKDQKVVASRALETMSPTAVWRILQYLRIADVMGRSHMEARQRLSRQN